MIDHRESTWTDDEAVRIGAVLALTLYFLQQRDSVGLYGLPDLWYTGE